MIYKLVMAAHIALYRLTRGRLGGKSIILLTTTGKRTGQPRTKPLFHIRDGGDYIVIASAGGSPKNPAWYANLSANPRVTLEDHGHTLTGTASTVGADDRARVWEAVVSQNPGFKSYEHRTAREIPLVRIRSF